MLANLHAHRKLAQIVRLESVETLELPQLEDAREMRQTVLVRVVTDYVRVEMLQFDAAYQTILQLLRRT